MRIAILTQPLRYNFGGILQNYALQTVLKRMGHEVVTIDPNQYIKTTWKTPLHVLKRFIINHLIMRRNIDPIWEYRKNNKLRKLESNTGRFIKKHIKVCKYNIINEIDITSFDAFIVGSDQVWRPQYNIGRLTNMFLDFTEGTNIKRVAYAASFGTEEWEFSEEETNKCKKLLERFDGISVREDSGVELCNKYFNREAIHVLDPTMLLTKEDYMKLFASNNSQREGKNLFYYILDEEKSKTDYIKEEAIKMGLDTFTVNACVDMNSIKAISQRIQPPVEDWLKAFQDAEYVITDSFHGTVFSILFNKPFTVILNEKRGSARIDSLLKMFHLEQRLHRSNCLKDNPCIDWNIVNGILSTKRKEAFEFISKHIE